MASIYCSMYAIMHRFIYVKQMIHCEQMHIEIYRESGDSDNKHINIHIQ